MDTWEDVDNVLKGDLSTDEFLGLQTEKQQNTRVTPIRSSDVIFEDGTSLCFCTSLPSSLILTQTNPKLDADSVMTGGALFPLQNLLHFGIVLPRTEVPSKSVDGASSSKTK